MRPGCCALRGQDSETQSHQLSFRSIFALCDSSNVSVGQTDVQAAAARTPASGSAAASLDAEGLATRRNPAPQSPSARGAAAGRHGDTATRVARLSPHASTPLGPALRGVTPPAPCAHRQRPGQRQPVTNSRGVPAGRGADWRPRGHSAGVPSHQEHLIRAFKGGSSESQASRLPC